MGPEHGRRKEIPGHLLHRSRRPCDKDNADKKKKGKKKPEVCSKPLTFSCGELHTYYKAPLTQDSAAVDTAQADSMAQDSAVAKEFSVKNTQMTVCDPGSVTIEGTFDQTDPDATLFVKLGNYTSRNLVPLSANGEFSHSITINDLVGNWDVKKATVEYKGKSGNHKQVIEIEANKTCPQVNQGRPRISFMHNDSVSCIAKFSLTGANGDVVIVEREMDGDLIKETTFQKDGTIKFDTKSGIHSYTLKAKDLAGNKGSITKELGCYPQKIASVEFTGGPKERLRVPPPPRGMSNTFTKNMHFRITNVDGLNPAQIKRIQVIQGEESLLNISHRQITDLDQTLQVNLTRGETTVITVIVDMKNGKRIVATKTYEAH